MAFMSTTVIHNNQIIAKFIFYEFVCYNMNITKLIIHFFILCIVIFNSINNIANIKHINIYVINKI